ncbi:MAG: sigma-70 family RNA polymerase sigma factor [Bryobacterales bacterium]|nr:sigma-70 family RNA polymerase sigma factor [Bryobacterales bacterium]
MEVARQGLGEADTQKPPAWPGWPDEAAFLSDLRSGRDCAYEALLDRFQHPVFNLVSRLIDDRADAADVTQDVFLKVFRSIGSFRGESSLKTWVYRMAVNESHNRRRWFGRHRKPEVGLESDDESRGVIQRVSDPSRSPYDLALSHEWGAALEKALNGLNPVYRPAVVLRDVEEMSYEEIAEVLNLNLGTVKSRILRGREALRRSLMEQMEPGRVVGLTPQPVE